MSKGFREIKYEGTQINIRGETDLTERKTKRGPIEDMQESLMSRKTFEDIDE